MTPSQLRAKVVTTRLDWISQMTSALRALPLGSYAAFAADSRNVAAAESYLRRALEALPDLGRHVLAKGFGQPASEYKDIGRMLTQVGVLDEANGMLLRGLAGYRNRMVHFYDEVTTLELYEVCSAQLGDIDSILAAILGWINAHPERIDRQL